MNVYTLNTAGQKAVTEIVKSVCRSNCIPSAFFEDAERAANDNEDSFEIRGHYTNTKNPLIVFTDSAWFDVETVDAE